MIGIYKLTSPSGKIYIGSSIDINKRVAHYKVLDCKAQVKLYHSLLKYGYDNHTLEILEECDSEILYERERHYGEIFEVLTDKGLNLALPKVVEFKFSLSEEARIKKSISQTGSLNNFYGRTHTPECIQRMSSVKKGKKLTDDHKRKVSLNHAKNNSKLVIDLETGIFYDSIKEAAIAKEINHSTLKSRVNGTSPTKTMIAYA